MGNVGEGFTRPTVLAGSEQRDNGFRELATALADVSGGLFLEVLTECKLSRVSGDALGGRVPECDAPMAVNLHEAVEETVRQGIVDSHILHGEMVARPCDGQAYKRIALEGALGLYNTMTGESSLLPSGGSHEENSPDRCPDPGSFRLLVHGYHQPAPAG